MKDNLRIVAVAALAAGIIWLTVYGLGGVLPVWFAVALGLLITVLAVALRPVVRAAAVDDIDPLPLPDDVIVSVPALGALESRLSGSSHSWHVYRTRLRPELVELAADRLRRRHGVDVDLDPDAARAVLGEELWQWMTTPPAETDDPSTRGPDVRTLDRLLRRITAI